MSGHLDKRQEEGADRPLSSGWWMDEWLKATSAWTNPASWEGAAGVAPAAERVLLEIVEGVARRFAGQRLSIAHAGAPISLVLDSLQLRHRPKSSGQGGGRRVEVRVGGQDLDVQGWRFDGVEAVSQHVNLGLGLPSVMSAESVDVVLWGPVDRLLPRLEERIAPEWRLTPAEKGRFVARPRSRPKFAVLIQPVFMDEHIRLEVVAAFWKGAKVTLPGWLRLARSWRVPEMPGGGKLHEASLADGILTARVRYERLSQVINLEEFRRAVQQGEPTLGLR
jgi:hypothetical protein